MASGLGGEPAVMGRAIPEPGGAAARRFVRGPWRDGPLTRVGPSSPSTALANGTPPASLAKRAGRPPAFPPFDMVRYLQDRMGDLEGAITTLQAGTDDADDWSPDEGLVGVLLDIICEEDPAGGAGDLDGYMDSLRGRWTRCLELWTRAVKRKRRRRRRATIVRLPNGAYRATLEQAPTPPCPVTRHLRDRGIREPHNTLKRNPGDSAW